MKVKSANKSEFSKREDINTHLYLNEEEGEMVCAGCNGWGHLYYIDENVVVTCERCLGAGKMDWIDNARGGLIDLSTSGYGQAGPIPASRGDSKKIYGIARRCRK